MGGERGEDASAAGGAAGLDDRAAEERLLSLAVAAGGIAHDLNNLLAVTLSYCELLARDEGLGQGAKASVQGIWDSTQRATELVRRLLALGRDPAARVRPVDLNGVVEDVSALVMRVLGADVTIELDLCPGLPPAQGDVLQVERSIMNLLLNASGAMPDGGVIRIQTSRRSGARGFDGAEIGGPCLVVAVSDTGAGMSPEIRARVFEPLFSTKPVGVGTGLGLTSVHRWLCSCGGVIDVESEPGRGSTFTLALPYLVR